MIRDNNRDSGKSSIDIERQLVLIISQLLLTLAIEIFLSVF